MDKFYQLINKFKPGKNTNAYAPVHHVHLDTFEGMARATLKNDGPDDWHVITITSNIPYEGIDAAVSFEDLKAVARVDDLERITCDNKTISWIGDLTMTVPTHEVDKIHPFVEMGNTYYDILKSDFDFVMLATSTDKARPVLCGIAFDGGDMVSTDGYRLHYKGDPGETVSIDTDLLKKIPGSFFISHNEKYSIIAFTEGDCTVQIKASHLVGSFPSYKVIIPKVIKQTFTLPYDKRLKKIAKDDMMNVTVNEKITLKAWTVGSSHIVTTLELDGCADEPIEFGVDPRFLIAAMDGKDATIGFNAANCPISVNDNAIVMPKRIN